MKLPKDKNEGISYWESMADCILALLLCILLLAMLLILYLVRIPDDDYTDYYEYSTMGSDDDGSYYDDYNSYYETDYTDDGNGYVNGDGGGDGGGGDDGGDGDYDDEPVSGGDEDYGETISKAAVYVQVVDGETERTIKEEGINFELFGSDSTLQVLKTYYPDVEEYRQYTTDSAGTFYLPEKIPFGTYTLKNISTVEGYETAGDVTFTIDYPDNYNNAYGYYYDWSDPYVVTVKLYPGKNTLTFTYTDKSTGDPIEGAEFEIIAAEDILTKDDSVRYESGTVVDTITSDENGAGESIELYYGNYKIHQVTTPDYYAAQVDDIPVEVVSSSDEAYETESIQAEKSTVTLSLTDQLYSDTPLADAEFNLTTEDGEILSTVSTDAHGKISITDLDKNATYKITQVSAPEGYIYEGTESSFTVDADGLINGAATSAVSLNNYMIRTTFSVRDKLIRSQVSDVNIVLYDSNDTVIGTWNTSAIDQEIAGIEPGVYRVVLDGKEAKAQTITVQDDYEIQSFKFYSWSFADVGLFAGGFVLLILAIIGGRFLILRRKAEKSTEKKNTDL